jgi:hypothetical protein
VFPCRRSYVANRERLAQASSMHAGAATAM